MKQYQVCPHCNAINRVAGLFTQSKLHQGDKPPNGVLCGFCGKEFPPKVETEDKEPGQ